MINGFGGGFFFAPFTYALAFAANISSSGSLINQIGPWSTVVDPLPQAARWVQMMFLDGTSDGEWFLQLGLAPGGSAPGSEVVFQPTVGVGFFHTGGDGNNFQTKTKTTYNFPVSIQNGQRLSIRVSSYNRASIQVLGSFINVWG